MSADAPGISCERQNGGPRPTNTTTLFESRPLSSYFSGPNKVAGSPTGATGASRTVSKIEGRRVGTSWAPREEEWRMFAGDPRDPARVRRRSAFVRRHGSNGSLGEQRWHVGSWQSKCHLSTNHAATNHIRGTRKQHSSPQMAAQHEPRGALDLKASILMLHNASGLHHVFLQKKGCFFFGGKKNLKIVERDDGASLRTDIGQIKIRRWDWIWMEVFVNTVWSVFKSDGCEVL